MLKLVKKSSLPQLQQCLLGKKARFVSDCKMFPNFDVKCKVAKIWLGANNEIIFDVITIPQSKKMKIGGNMSKLSYELLST